MPVIDRSLNRRSSLFNFCTASGGELLPLAFREKRRLDLLGSYGSDL